MPWVVFPSFMARIFFEVCMADEPLLESRSKRRWTEGVGDFFNCAKCLAPILLLVRLVDGCGLVRFS